MGNTCQVCNFEQDKEINDQIKKAIKSDLETRSVNDPTMFGK